jgi:hypothetical protein
MFTMHMARPGTAFRNLRITPALLATAASGAFARPAAAAGAPLRIAMSLIEIPNL